MKQPCSIFLLVLSCGTFLGAQAQVISLRDASGALVNGTVITVNEPLSGDSEQTPGVGLSAENTSGSDLTINVRRYEQSVPAGTANYFCWYECYDAVPAGLRPVWTALDPIYMTNGQTVNGFHGYYKPNGIVGEATFRYVWFDLANPNDSTWVDLVFNMTEPAGIAEEASAVRAFMVFPNPSTGGDITINYDLTTTAAGTQLEIYNVLGERKLVQPISAAQGKMTLREGDLSSGVWFAVLKRNGKALATKRVVVAR
ncbi:MAG: T9SS type A sorting domain-containing protein [Flavobacteriales bacterium]|nr:T9SS type A sorting domain-containing protein [Flavobacteriales bacterium]MBK9599844.1 T9SS type A sorting domain-containing protein [Flavobacteriales bacterium]